jgi:succinate dehydrogenase assembly factor 1
MLDLTHISLPKSDILCRSEFREHQKHDKKDYSAIEYMLRKGQRQLEIYASPGIRNIMK